MKITSFKIYLWHSINLIPNWSSVALCEDEPPFSITGRWFNLSVLGIVFSLVVKGIKGAEAPARFSKVRGTLYSRKRKAFYRIKQD